MIYDVEVVRNILIPLRNEGCDLAADLFLPRGAPPGPALVTLLPYHKDGEVGIEQWSANRYFAARGYATLLADFRGTGSSGGRARPPLDLGDAEDGAAVVQWTAAQPWCDGRVGMWGRSQGGMIALQTATLRPPALKAIVAIGAFIDAELDVVHPRGLRGCLTPLGWGITNLLRQLMPPLTMDAAGRWERIWRERLDVVEPYLLDLYRHAPGDPGWRERAVDVSGVEVPTFCVTGWRDVFLDASLRAFERISAPKKLLLGPWMHARPDEAPADAIDFLAAMATWWDHWLRGIDNGTEREPPLTVFIQGAGEWRRFHVWPATEPLLLRTGAEGHLGQPTDDTRATVPGVVSVPADPTVGVGSGLWYYPSPGWGFPTDQADDDRRSAAFTTAPLAEPLRILGRARVRVRLHAATGARGTVVAKLADVDPRGRSVIIAAGAKPAHEADRDGLLTIELTPTAYEVQPRHALRLALAGADFPRLWPDPEPTPLAIVCGSHHHATRLELPTAPGQHGGDTSEPLPPVPPPGLPPQVILSQPPRYTVGRELIDDAATVSIQSNRLIRSIDGVSTVRLDHLVSATVPRSRPSGARLSGVSAAEITTPDGPIRVRAEALVTGAYATARGEIAVGEQEIFRRTWTAPFGDSHTAI